MTYTAEPARRITVDVDFSDDMAFDGLNIHETTHGSRNGGKRREAE